MRASPASHGSVKGWGGDAGGELGDGTLHKWVLHPMQTFERGSGIIQLLASNYPQLFPLQSPPKGDEHMLALLSNGQVLAWGGNIWDSSVKAARPAQPRSSSKGSQAPSSASRWPGTGDCRDDGPSLIGRVVRVLSWILLTCLCADRRLICTGTVILLDAASRPMAERVW